MKLGEDLAARLPQPFVGRDGREQQHLLIVMGELANDLQPVLDLPGRIPEGPLLLALDLRGVDDLTAHAREHHVVRRQGHASMDAVEERVDRLDVVGLPQVPSERRVERPRNPEGLDAGRTENLEHGTVGLGLGGLTGQVPDQRKRIGFGPVHLVQQTSQLVELSSRLGRGEDPSKVRTITASSGAASLGVGHGTLPPDVGKAKASSGIAGLMPSIRLCEVGTTADTAESPHLLRLSDVVSGTQTAR